jgi:hypothetical protein
LLKKFEGTPPEAVIPLPAIQHGRVLPEPDKVIKVRPSHTGDSVAKSCW